MSVQSNPVILGTKVAADLLFANALVTDTGDARGIEGRLLYLKDFPEEALRIRNAARATARNFTWEPSVRYLNHKLEHQASLQGVLAGRGTMGEKSFGPARLVAESVRSSSGAEGGLPGESSV
jgi:hypothetical protein